MIDERVASNLRRLRERRGWSQADLSAKMTELGWRYFPQTVHKNENGQRKITVGEAEALARIFDISVDRFFWLQGEDAEVSMIESAIARLREAWGEASTASMALAMAIAVGERALADARKSKHKRVHETAEFLEAELADASVQSAFEDGLGRWEESRYGGG